MTPELESHARQIAAHLLDEVAAVMADNARRCKEGAGNARRSGHASHARNGENLGEAFTHAEMALLRRAHRLLGHPETGIPLRKRPATAADEAPDLFARELAS